MTSAILANSIASRIFTQTKFEDLPQDVQEFIRAARKHDWSHEHSDSYETVKRGRIAEKQLQKQCANLLAGHEPQAVVEVWNRTVSSILKSRGLTFTPITTADVYAWAGQESLPL